MMHLLQALASGDMIKMDAGCELHGYNSDITRCWPVNGSFSPQQRAIYKAVLEINRLLPFSVTVVNPLSYASD
jgi:intermediate cleaving peptidase 55